MKEPGTPKGPGAARRRPAYPRTAGPMQGSSANTCLNSSRFMIRVEVASRLRQCIRHWPIIERGDFDTPVAFREAQPAVFDHSPECGLFIRLYLPPTERLTSVQSRGKRDWFAGDFDLGVSRTSQACVVAATACVMRSVSHPRGDDLPSLDRDVRRTVHRGNAL